MFSVYGDTILSSISAVLAFLKRPQSSFFQQPKNVKCSRHTGSRHIYLPLHQKYQEPVSKSQSFKQPWRIWQWFWWCVHFLSISTWLMNWWYGWILPPRRKLENVKNCFRGSWAWRNPRFDWCDLLHHEKIYCSSELGKVSMTSKRKLRLIKGLIQSGYDQQPFEKGNRGLHSKLQQCKWTCSKLLKTSFFATK